MLEEKPKKRLGKPTTSSDATSEGALTGTTRPAPGAGSARAEQSHPPSIHNRARLASSQPPAPAPAPAGPQPFAVPKPAAPAPSAPKQVIAPRATPRAVAIEEPDVPMSAMPATPTPPGSSRAGRNLPMAIAVGVGLGAAIILSLVIYPPSFLVIVLAAVLVSVWELTRALRTARVRPPLVPLLLGAVAMVLVTWLSGPGGLAVTTMLTVLAGLVWRLSDGPVGYFRDASTAVLITVYVPLLACFAVLMLRVDDGATRIAAFVLTVVCSDVGGYVAGVLFGKHPMSPTVSPKKSWEGLGGSVLACMAAGVVMVGLVLDGEWWQGIVYGAAIAVTATLGDLGESAVKRDLGIKDMGTLLPGHGGLMDRMDSLLPSAAVAYLLLTAFVGAG